MPDSLFVGVGGIPSDLINNRLVILIIPSWEDFILVLVWLLADKWISWHGCCAAVPVSPSSRLTSNTSQWGEARGSTWLSSGTFFVRTETSRLNGEEEQDLSRNNRKIAVESLNKNGNVQDLINFVNEKNIEAPFRAVTNGKYDLDRDRILLTTEKRKVEFILIFNWK